jgi:hypothetical protein
VLESLAGRLKWERTEDGIRVEIPDPVSFADFLGIIVAAALPFVAYRFFEGYPWSANPWGLATVCAVSLLWAVPNGIALVGRKRLVILTSAALTETSLESCAKGRRQLTYTLWNLRSNPRISLMGNECPDQIQVEIQTTSGTWTIGSRLTGTEADALISKMTEVFVVPEWMPMFQAAVSPESGSVRG